MQLLLQSLYLIKTYYKNYIIVEHRLSIIIGTKGEN